MTFQPEQFANYRLNDHPRQINNWFLILCHYNLIKLEQKMVKLWNICYQRAGFCENRCFDILNICWKVPLIVHLSCSYTSCIKCIEKWCLMSKSAGLEILLRHSKKPVTKILFCIKIWTQKFVMKDNVIGMSSNKQQVTAKERKKCFNYFLGQCITKFH